MLSVPRIASRTSAVVALTGLMACSPSDGGILVPGSGPGAVVAVVVSPSSASMEVGLTLQTDRDVGRWPRQGGARGRVLDQLE